jgi:hypothetical protein
MDGEPDVGVAEEPLRHRHAGAPHHLRTARAAGVVEADVARDGLGPASPDVPRPVDTNRRWDQSFIAIAWPVCNANGLSGLSSKYASTAMRAPGQDAKP